VKKRGGCNGEKNKPQSAVELHIRKITKGKVGGLGDREWAKGFTIRDGERSTTISAEPRKRYVNRENPDGPKKVAKSRTRCTRIESSLTEMKRGRPGKEGRKLFFMYTVNTNSSKTVVQICPPKNPSTTNGRRKDQKRGAEGGG